MNLDFLDWSYDNSSILDSNEHLDPTTVIGNLFLKQEVILENGKEKQWHAWIQNKTVL